MKKTMGREIALRKTTTSLAGRPSLASLVKVSLPAKTSRATTISMMPRKFSVLRKSALALGLVPSLMHANGPWQHGPVKSAWKLLPPEVLHAHKRDPLTHAIDQPFDVDRRRLVRS